MIEVYWFDKAGWMQPTESGVYWWDENIKTSVAIGHLAVALYHYLKEPEQ